jgi:hypothetical protein
VSKWALQERAKPQLVEDEEPGFRQNVTHASRGEPE